MKVTYNENGRRDIYSDGTEEKKPEVCYIKTPEIERIMNRPLNEMQILQAYYADLFTIAQELNTMFEHAKVLCTQSGTLCQALFLYMRAEVYDNRYDNTFKELSNKIFACLNANKDEFDKNEFFKALSLAKRLSYMTDTNAKRLALSCHSIEDYNIKIDKVFKGEKRADYYENR